MIKEQEIIELLEDIGLTHSQSVVYLSLLKAGTKGSIVRELDHALDIHRTNIYPILNDLIKLGCVKQGGSAVKSKNAKIFIAIEPVKVLDQLIERKNSEINKLLEIKKKHSYSLQNIFNKGVEISLDEIDAKLIPYFQPLLNSGWTLQSYIERKELTMFNYQVFDCVLYAPHAKFLKDCSFHLFLFDYDIEKDKDALRFFEQGLKRKTKEMRSYFYDIKQFQLIDDTMSLFDKQVHCFEMQVKIKDLEKSEYFAKILKKFKDEKRKNQYYKIGKAIILPLKEKIFYLWAESDKIIKEMVAPIFITEGN